MKARLLTKPQLLVRLRRHGRQSFRWLLEQDAPAARCVLIHFESLQAAYVAAGVTAAVSWSEARTVRELQHAPKPHRLRELRAHSPTLAAAIEHHGGIEHMNLLAAAPALPRGLHRMNRTALLDVVVQRFVSGATMAAVHAPPALMAAAVRHFKTWELAVAASEARYPRRRRYTQSSTLAALRALHAAEPALTATGLQGKKKLRRALERFLGSIAAALAYANVRDWPVVRNTDWTRARLMAELRQRRAQGIVTLTPKISEACIAHFGSVFAAREAAGVPHIIRKPWTQATLIVEFQQRARRGDVGADLCYAARRLFGSIAKARHAAGAPLLRRGWTHREKQQVLDGLREAVALASQISHALALQAVRHFGSMAQARKAAGLPASRKGVAWHTATKAELIEGLQQQAVTGFDSTLLRRACLKRFGSLPAAKRAAGLRTSPTRGTRPRGGPPR